MKKVSDILFIVVFLLICLVPLGSFEFGSDVISTIDNDYLPEYSGLRNRDLLRNYFSKRIGFRREAVILNNIINDRLFHVITNDSFFYGRSGYIFIKEDGFQYNDYFEDFSAYLISLKDHLESKEIKFYVVIDPSKNYVLDSRLYGYQKNDYEYLEKFINRLETNGVCVIDNASYLKESDDREEFYNIKHDPYHWNDKGALYGTNNLIDTLKKDYPSLPYIGDDDYVINNRTMDYSLNGTLPVNEIIDVYEFDTKYDDLSEQYRENVEISEIFNEFHYFRNDPGYDLKALVFEGSYYLSEDRNKFLIPLFSELICIHNYENIFNAPYYVERFSPDIVIFELANYTMKEYFFSQWKMNNNALIN